MQLYQIGNVGYQYDLAMYVVQMLQDDPPSNLSIPVILKLAIDGAIMTLHRKISQVISGIHYLCPGAPLSQTKSPDSCHVVTMYIGGETEAELCAAFNIMSNVCLSPFKYI